MRTPAAVLLVTALWFVLPERPATITAQQPPQVAKWEYAELSCRVTPGRPAGRDKDGNDVPPGQGAVAIRWTTGGEEVTVKGWDELAEKLKVQVKKDASVSQHKIQAMNALGAAGWDLLAQEASAPGVQAVGMAPGIGPGPGGGVMRVPGVTTTWLFKRRMP
jgi:hypothetical protein